MKENFLVTGGSGYVGKILLTMLIQDNRVDNIVVIDKDDLKEDLKSNPKIIFIHKNLIEDWESELKNIEEKNNFKLTKVVHLAWQIRSMYGKKKMQNEWNIGGTKKVYEFVKNSSSVSTFVHFSTVASYGAYPDNTFDQVFFESTPFRKTDYLYAEEKRIVEEELDKINFPGKNVFVIRPASITGPSGRERTGFGLQSVLGGKVKGKGFIQSIIFSTVKNILNFMPATTGWARQFVYEEDIVQAIFVMCFNGRHFDKIEKYNLCPAGGFIDAEEMGKMLNKKVIYLHPQVVRVLCFLAWHLTLGKIPTSSGVWKAYSYPIIVDGSKIEKDFPEFKYKKNIRDAYKN